MPALPLRFAPDRARRTHDEPAHRRNRCHPRRRRRLDLRAVARQLLSRRAGRTARELEYASRKLTAIEVNGTYYSTQKPATFAKWRDETPDDFVFSLKANRFATNRRVLAEAGESVQRFVDSGIAELGAEARADRVAVRADQTLRRRGLRGLPQAAARRGERPAAAARARRAPRQLQLRRLPGAGAPPRRGHGVHRLRRLPVVRRRHRRLRLRAHRCAPTRRCRRAARRRR